MKFSELSTEVKAMVGITTTVIAAIVGTFVWQDARYASRAEFDNHIADVACNKAIDNYLEAKARAAKYPNDDKLARDLEEARELKDFSCGKKKKG